MAFDCLVGGDLGGKQYRQVGETRYAECMGWGWGGDKLICEFCVMWG
jgi:hypothetical protein